MNVYMLIDRSRSMAPNWAETVGAVNAYVEALAEKKKMKKSKITVAVFDGNGTGVDFKVVRDAQAAGNWKPISEGETPPRGNTPLFDAVGKLNEIIIETKPKQATVAIMTDGYENASREMSRDAAKGMLDKIRKSGFDVVFLGADFDTFAQAQSLGGAVGQSLNVAKGSYATAMSDLASRTTAYATSGSVAEFSVKERKRAAGQ